MHIQLNTDTHITESDALAEQVEKILSRELKHRRQDITRVEVHLSDVNSHRGGSHDKRCLLEARITGLQPITAEERADTIERAIIGAAERLSRAVENTIGKAAHSRTSHESIKSLDQSDEVLDQSDDVLDQDADES